MDGRARFGIGNPGGSLARSPGMRKVMQRKGEEAALLYQGMVRSRSGILAANVIATTRMGIDGYEAVVISGAPYAASYEFGFDLYNAVFRVGRKRAARAWKPKNKPRMPRGTGPRTRIAGAQHHWPEVLAAMAAGR